MKLRVYLQGLQAKSGVSLNQWAAKSGVHRTTLWRWLHEEVLPRDKELQAALMALQVTNDEQEQALFLLSQTRIQQGGARTASLAGIPVVRHDLLRALRLRKNYTQTEAATLCGVTRTQLVRWESGENWPSEDRLRHVCQTLEATPEEVTALVCADVSSEPLFLRPDEEVLHQARKWALGFSPKMTTTDVQLLLAHLTGVAQNNSNALPLPDVVSPSLLPLPPLEFLLWKSRLQQIARQKPEADRVLNFVIKRQMRNLCEQQRFTEAIALAQVLRERVLRPVAESRHAYFAEEIIVTEAIVARSQLYCSGIGAPKGET